MAINRRAFLGVAGMSALGVAGGAAGIAAKGGNGGGGETKEKKRYAMVIDTTKCASKEGCKKCMEACDHCHNIPDFGDDKAHEIKWIWKQQFIDAFPGRENEYADEKRQKLPIVLMCNHCDNPPCVRVCPTQATWKREEDGVVMMDWHRCIGCRYCMAGCPYGSRSFNWFDPRPYIKEETNDFPTRTKGVVEKCTFCDERLARGQQPACVESCDQKALVFGDLKDPDSEVRQLLAEKDTIRRKPQLGTHPEVFYIL